MTTVGQICIRNVLTAEPREAVTEIALRMKTHHVGCLVVIDVQDRGNVPIGMVTDRDLVLEVLATPPASMDRVVLKHVMSPAPTVVREDAPLSTALHHMRQAGVRRLPVVSGEGALVGLISLDDIIEKMAAELSSVCATENEARDPQIDGLAEGFNEIAQLLGRERQHEQGRELDRMASTAAGCSS